MINDPSLNNPMFGSTRLVYALTLLWKLFLSVYILKKIKMGFITLWAWLLEIITQA